jgi:steroid delta-isomerase-like uncharacterized protein
MSAQENKALYMRNEAKIWNEGDMSAADGYYAPDVVLHGAPPDFPPGIEGIKQGVAMYRAALPDLHMTMDDVIVEGDKVVCRYTMRGTHKGELLGISASGKQVAMEGIVIVRFQDGKLAEIWGVSDTLRLMQQVGAIPAPA